MANRKVYVAQAWPERSDPTWARRFAEALRAHEFDVVEEWSSHDQASQAAVEQGLRESELIVLLLEADGAGSPIFYFEYGVALAGDKEFVAVVPADVPPDQLPVPVRGGRYVVKGSPDETAAALVARSAEPQPV